jgi:spermidine synthase
MPHSKNEDHHNVIFHEMMSHPALFTHPHPKKIAIIGDETNCILAEVLKHPDLTEIIFISKKNSANQTNPKIKFYCEDSAEWIKKIAPHSIDIIIHAAAPVNELLQTFFALLHTDGILIQQSSSLFESAGIKSLSDQLRNIGFNDQRIMHFPQPGFSFGWRSIVMACKKAGFKRIQEKAIFTRPFKTYYYNLDTHKASLVLPEFMREEWAI